ncbi:hypothetical protein [Duganella vulcania]|uniref:Uncharacterized protein n=1 Tax=Duganella vulcania TaxID=2692166 RepID=A0A845GIV7_9BURK|nr:hypothetical protein [Duganella vulcania]MYM92687.1 hypothetical protein [Duganella vulcania]
MQTQRTFLVSLYCGEGNSTHLKASYNRPTAFEAFDAFCHENQCIGYPLKPERPEQRDDGLYAVWSGGCSISGQRIYVKERIGS